MILDTKNFIKKSRNYIPQQNKYLNNLYIAPFMKAWFTLLVSQI